MVYLKALLFVIFVPGTVLVVIPYFLVASGKGLFEIGMGRGFGLVPFLLGAVTFLWCVWDFARIGHGTPAPFDPPKALVVSGPYRLVRNPMFLGVIFVLVGEALLFGSLALLAWALVLGVGTHTFVVFYEEPTLRKKFGKGYEDYRRSVPRWVPRLGRSAR